MFYISACHVVLLCLPFSCLDFCQMISGFATTTIGASKETEELGVSTDWCAARLLDDLWCLMCLINMYGGSLSACTMHEFVCYASVVCSTWKDASRNGSEGTWSDTGRFASLLPNIAWLHVHSISVLHWRMCASLQRGASMSFWPLAETFRRSLTSGERVYSNIFEHMNQSIDMIASSSIRMSQDAVVPENPYNNIQVPKGFYVDRLYLSLLYPFPTHSLTEYMRGKWLTEWASEWVTEWLTHDLRSEICHSHPSPRVFC